MFLLFKMFEKFRILNSSNILNDKTFQTSRWRGFAISAHANAVKATAGVTPSALLDKGEI